MKPFGPPFRRISEGPAPRRSNHFTGTDGLMHRFALAATAALALVALPQVAAAESAPTSPLAITADTTFNAEGNYTLTVTVGGQAMTMTFTVARKPDGSLGGVFKHEEMGSYSTTSFKVDGRRMSMTIETEGGPAMIVLQVNAEQAVEGEWSMAGDGSKISGKKVS